MSNLIKIRQYGDFSSAGTFLQADRDPIDVRQQAFGQNLTRRPESPGRVTVDQENLVSIQEDVLGIVS